MENLLKKTPVAQPPAPPPKPVDVIAQKYVNPVKKAPARRAKKQPKIRTQPSFSKTQYISRLPTLLCSFVGYGAAAFLFWRIDPATIQNVLVPNTYLPLLLALAEGHFFFFSYVLMNSRRGTLITVALTLLLFLKLQHVLTLISGGIVVAPFFLTEFFWTLSG